LSIITRYNKSSYGQKGFSHSSTQASFQDIALRAPRRLPCARSIHNLRGIGHEYAQAYGQPSALQLITITTSGEPSQGFRLKAVLGGTSHPNGGDLRFLKAITGFRHTTGVTNEFHSETIQAQSEEEALPLLVNKVRRNLLYETIFSQLGPPAGTLTPLSNGHLLLPEEIPIWLAFHHLY
jgi:hypothetical protein